MSHFNELTPAEAERLALLLEELGEAQQVIGKILRHGLNSWHPDSVRRTTNRELLEKELGDVRFAIDLLCAAEDINRLAITEAVMRKAGKVKQYIHHQPAELLSRVQKEWTP